MPTDGFFCVPARLDEEVTELTRAPFPDRIVHTELFFRGTIPLDHFEIEEI